MESTYRAILIFWIFSESSAILPDWTTEVCRSGMCFNGESDCRESCTRICREQGGRGFCYFDNFLSRVFICWCGFDLPETSTVAAATAPSTIISTLTPTTGSIELKEDCGTTQCYSDRHSCDSACASHCQLELYSCDQRWHGRYKCQCIQQVIVQPLH
ncbi:uncharacterized protein LOC128178591 [Crassostrea angulata]|uniref:uncharacterized protein LOC128178591 n=1 Tax=Magallana angulata TaxID=2784310 RepID=UPI0022B1A4D4|nr:uncharacterized protein LOC128178591 [Crassostrea angulata]